MLHDVILYNIIVYPILYYIKCPTQSIVDAAIAASIATATGPDWLSPPLIDTRVSSSRPNPCHAMLKLQQVESSVV